MLYSYDQEDLSFILMNVGGTRGGLIILLEDVLRLISLEDFNSQMLQSGRRTCCWDEKDTHPPS